MWVTNCSSAVLIGPYVICRIVSNEKEFIVVLALFDVNGFFDKDRRLELMVRLHLANNIIASVI